MDEDAEGALPGRVVDVDDEVPVGDHAACEFGEEGVVEWFERVGGFAQVDLRRRVLFSHATSVARASWLVGGNHMVVVLEG